MQRPLTLTVELVRANNASDPFAFELQTQRYLSRGAAGDFRSSEFFWSPHLLEDLDAVRRPGRDPVVVQRTGEALRRFLSSADWEEHEPAILEAASAGRPVYVTLRFAAAELYALPWELLTIKRTGQHIGELPGVLLNYEWPGIASAPEKPSPRPEHGRVLFAWSAAGGAVPAGEHITALLRASRASSYPFDEDRDVLPHASYAGLERVLREAASGAPIAVLHLLCHGGKAGSSFGVVLNSDEGSGEAVVDAGRMRQLLAPYAGAVRLVVLSACDSGNSGEIGNQLGSIAQTLHRAGIAAVLSSRFPLSRQGAVAVCQSLYRALMVESRPLEEAVLAARAELARDSERLDWASLQLYSSSWSTNNDDYDNRPLVFRPYRGLLPFLPEHSGFYRGREPEVEEVFSDLAALVRSGLPRFLLIAGASGTGKSSLVMAGVLPRAAAEGWHVVQLRPGSEPLQQLSATLSHLPSQPSDTPLLLVVDQLEELGT